MRYRKLGSTGIEVSELGFGTWGLSGTSYGPVDDSVSIQALNRAFELGVTLYDTSDLYGNGHSETILGKGLNAVRSKIVIATKGGLLPHTGFEMPMDFSVDYLRRALEASLKRLNTDYVDLYQLHSPILGELYSGEMVDFLEQLLSEGKIRAYGVSVRAPKDGLEAINNLRSQAIQMNFNLIDQRAIECGLFDLAKKTGTGLIGRTPLCFGFLTGMISESSEFADGDHRKNWPKEQLKRWSDGVELFKQQYESVGQTAIDLALRFCLSFDEISTVIPGMMNVAEVESNVQSATYGPLNTAQLSAIEQIYTAHQFYDPSVKNTQK